MKAIRPEGMATVVRTAAGRRLERRADRRPRRADPHVARHPRELQVRTDAVAAAQGHEPRLQGGARFHHAGSRSTSGSTTPTKPSACAISCACWARSTSTASSRIRRRPQALRRLQDRRGSREAHEADGEAALGRIDRHRDDRSADRHRRELRQVHRRQEPRRHDRQDEHRSGGGDRAPSAPARYRRHHRRATSSTCRRRATATGSSRRSKTACGKTARARRSNRSRRSGCSNSRASASAKISPGNCVRRVRSARVWAA